MKSANIGGDSDWSIDIKATTAVDVSKIPKPKHVYYDTSTKSVSFNVVNHPLGLVAKIELENNDGRWRPHAQLGMHDLPYSQMAINDPNPVTGLRIKLCLQSGEHLCG